MIDAMARSAKVETTEPTALETLIDDYLASCRARGLSRATIERAYGFSLRDVFLPWARRAGLREPGELTQRMLDRFTAELLDRGSDGGGDRPLSRNTVHSYVRPLRQLLVWGTKEGDISGGARPQLPRLPRRVIDVLSRDEILALENAASTERDKLVVRVLADTGLRVGEFCDLRIDSITRHERGALLKVRGKGDQERLVPIRPELARRLERFARSRSAEAEGDHLFSSHRRSLDGTYAPLTGSGVLQMLRGLAYRAGITKRVHPHLLRHSFATEALRRGMNPIQLAQILGHSGLRMIESVYSHLTATDSYDAMMAMLSSG
jgi:integrase/recombinase XerD